MDVPEMVLVAVSDPTQVERIFKPEGEKYQKPDFVAAWKCSPGAKTSTHLP